MNKLNIITRASRYNYLKENIQSIQDQEVLPDQHLLIDDFELFYNLMGTDVASLTHIERPQRLKVQKQIDGHYCYHAPYNEYLNEVRKYPIEGWIMYLDDDDMLASNTVVEELMDRELDPDTAYFFKGDFIRNVLPNETAIEYLSHHQCPPLGTIGGSNFIFHSKHLPNITWDAWSCSDIRVIDQLLKTTKRNEFIDLVVFKIQDKANNGNLKDKQ